MTRVCLTRTSAYLAPISTPRYIIMDNYNHLKVCFISIIYTFSNHFTGITPLITRFFSNGPHFSSSLRRCSIPPSYFRTCLLLFDVSNPSFKSHPVFKARSSLPKDKVALKEPLVATLASILGGFGVVALFCSVGVYV